MKPGDAFNPWRGACGFYPPDVVGRLRSFAVLKTKRKFSDGHQRLYELLVRRAGRDGQCFPGQGHLANTLGRSERTIRLWCEDLEAFALIARKSRGRGNGGQGQTDLYEFLWHPIFDRQKPTLFDRQEFTKSPVMTGKNEHFDRQESSTMTGRNQQSLYKEEKLKEEMYTAESSSSKVVGNSTKAKTTNAWTPVQLEELKISIARHRGNGFSPDTLIVSRIVEYLNSPEDGRLWIADLARRFPGRAVKNGFGFYLTDVRDWHSRRADAAAQDRHQAGNRNPPSADEEGFTGLNDDELELVVSMETASGVEVRAALARVRLAS